MATSLLDVPTGTAVTLTPQTAVGGQEVFDRVVQKCPGPQGEGVLEFSAVDKVDGIGRQVVVAGCRHSRERLYDTCQGCKLQGGAGFSCSFDGVPVWIGDGKQGVTKVVPEKK